MSDRQIEVAVGVRHQAKQVGGVGLAGPDRKHLPAYHLGFVRVSGAPRGACALDGLGDVDGRGCIRGRNTHGRQTRRNVVRGEGPPYRLIRSAHRTRQKLDLHHGKARRRGSWTVREVQGDDVPTASASAARAMASVNLRFRLEEVIFPCLRRVIVRSRLEARAGCPRERVCWNARLGLKASNLTAKDDVYR